MCVFVFVSVFLGKGRQRDATQRNATQGTEALSLVIRISSSYKPSHTPKPRLLRRTSLPSSDLRIPYPTSPLSCTIRYPLPICSSRRALSSLLTFSLSLVSVFQANEMRWDIYHSANQGGQGSKKKKKKQQQPFSMEYLIHSNRIGSGILYIERKNEDVSSAYIGSRKKKRERKRKGKERKGKERKGKERIR